MAVIYRRANASNIPANTRTLLYTVPAGKRAILKSLHQSTDLGQEVRMGITIFGQNGFIWNQRIPGPYEPRLWPLATVLEPGEQVHVEHNATQCYTMLTYVELDAAVEGANLYRASLLSVHAATRYTAAVPAGKKLRVREVVIGAHGSGGDYSVFVPNVGHLAEAHVPAGEDYVVLTDWVVNAGEQIGSSGSGAVCHVFISGVLEDV